MGAGTATPTETAEQKAEREAAEAAAKANGNGNGEALDGEHDDEQPQQPAVPPLVMEGGSKQLSLKVTGDTPDKATAKMVGGKIEIEAGDYQPGDVVEAVVRMRCTKVSIIDKMNNSTGERTEREREHQFKLMQIEKVAA